LNLFRVILWIKNFLLKGFKNSALIMAVLSDGNYRFFIFLAKERLKNSIR